jgi:hypothetical protein
VYDRHKINVWKVEAGRTRKVRGERSRRTGADLTADVLDKCDYPFDVKSKVRLFP